MQDDLIMRESPSSLSIPGNHRDGYLYARRRWCHVFLIGAFIHKLNDADVKDRLFLIATM